ncbi:hypothetical protein QAD02_019111 [Eretmocerus hayati]|uniref:Uncharacterized protein n=1 Tax=Eretmocerus hayati TaxID=131215 RepID=A0ACC2PI95_9HYME|nr:hypothetical protein QAD02_019111 [Eretmocerus hayati]
MIRTIIVVFGLTSIICIGRSASVPTGNSEAQAGGVQKAEAEASHVNGPYNPPQIEGADEDFSAIPERAPLCNQSEIEDYMDEVYAYCNGTRKDDSATSKSAPPCNQSEIEDFMDEVYAYCNGTRKDDSATSKSGSSPKSSRCPKENGFFPHNLYCDKYWACENGEAELRTCEDGLVFGGSDDQIEKCEYQQKVQCGERTKLQEPIFTGRCPRLYGIHRDPQNCNIYWKCSRGQATQYTCGYGKAFDDIKGKCVNEEEVFGCALHMDPESDIDRQMIKTFENHVNDYEKIPHPKDCSKYFVCYHEECLVEQCPRGEVFHYDASSGGMCYDREDVPCSRDGTGYSAAKGPTEKSCKEPKPSGEDDESVGSF